MAGAGAKAPAVVTTTVAVAAAAAAATTTVAAATPSVAAGEAVGMAVAGAAGAYMGRGHAGMRWQMRRRTNEAAREVRVYTTPHPTTLWNAQPGQLMCALLSRGCRESGGVPMHYDTMHAPPSFKKNVFNVFKYNYNIIIADTHFIP